MYEMFGLVRESVLLLHNSVRIRVMWWCNAGCSAACSTGCAAVCAALFGAVYVSACENALFHITSKCIYIYIPSICQCVWECLFYKALQSVHTFTYIYKYIWVRVRMPFFWGTSTCIYIYTHIHECYQSPSTSNNIHGFYQSPSISKKGR